MRSLMIWLFSWMSLSFSFHHHHYSPPKIQSYPKRGFLRMAIDEAVIVGSGPVGLATAIMLAQNGVEKIKVFDQLKEPVDPDNPDYWGRAQTERNYNMGLSGRSQVSLTKLGVWEQVKARAAEVFGSVTWKTDPPTFEKKIKRYETYCIERERLAGCLLQEIKNKYSDKVDVTFNTRCVDINPVHQSSESSSETENIYTLTFANTSSIGLNLQWDTENRIYYNSSFIIGADGSNSVVREYLIKNDPEFKTVVYEDTNTFDYRSVPLEFPKELIRKYCPDPNKFLTISGQSRSNIILESLPTKEGSHLTAILFRPNTLPNLTTLAEGKKFFEDNFPFTNNAITDDAILRFISSKDFKFPKFQYAFPKLHYKSNIVLLGDAIHSVKPYFGLGVNSGFEDVIVLRDSLKAHNWDLEKGLKQFSKERSPQAKAMVSTQQRADARFFSSFILPIILDKTFRKIPFLGSLFADTTINCFQDESYTYTGALKRKARDRTLQIAILATLLTGLIATAKAVITKRPFLF